MNLFTCTHGNKYTVLTSVSTRTYNNEYTHLRKQVHCTHIAFDVIVEVHFRATLPNVLSPQGNHIKIIKR